jgi:Fe-S cluster biogenesis protein NfuA
MSAAVFFPTHCGQFHGGHCEASKFGRRFHVIAAGRLADVVAHTLPYFRQPQEPEPSMVTRERVESVLKRVRPYLQADGGDIELVGLEGNSVLVRLTGVCATCPIANMTLHVAVEAALRDAIPEFASLRVR